MATHESDNSTENNSGEAQRVHHHATLNEIQIRAYRVHFEHGGISGGYTLDDWLEAEHELSCDTGSDSQPDSGE